MIRGIEWLMDLTTSMILALFCLTFLTSATLHEPELPTVVTTWFDKVYMFIAVIYGILRLVDKWRELRKKKDNENG